MADTGFNIPDPTGLIDNLKKLTEQLKITADSFKTGFENLEGGALALNKQFGQGRQRITELKMAVADATPVVDRLGGTLQDAVETTRQISDATRRNVVASTEDIGKLYAAGQILQDSRIGVKDLVEGFQDVGMQFSLIGDQVKDSITYIQSVGVNAGAVMEKVMENMSQMNRFNFQDGVQGLTKMATQATMLKFDMGQVFNLADRALDPQKAIELSAAFQRLGLSAGDLTDPFQLMYKSLNDPEGLQQSLVEMTKQFTYFDEQTKSFKISPAGMLQLRELESQTQISAKEMSKLALNTADLDRKLSMLRPSLKFENEEDKMYLANIAKMDKEGNYKVEFVDKAGQKVSENIENLTQEQLDMLIEQEKARPKDLEELQRSQLQNIETMSGDLRAIRDKVVLGVTSAPRLTMLAEDMGTIGKIVTDSLNKGVDIKNVRKDADEVMKDVKDIFKKLAKGESVDWSKLMEAAKGNFDFEKMQDKILEAATKGYGQIPKDVKERYNMDEGMFKGFWERFKSDQRPVPTPPTPPQGGNRQVPTPPTPPQGGSRQIPTPPTPPQRGARPTPTPPTPPQAGGIPNPAAPTTAPFGIPTNMNVANIDVESLKIGDSNLTDLLKNLANRTTKVEVVHIDKPVTNTNIPTQAIPTATAMNTTTTHKHMFDGTITWKIDAPPELDTKRFYAMIDKQEFKDTFTKIVMDKFKETEGTPISMNA